MKYWQRRRCLFQLERYAPGAANIVAREIRDYPVWNYHALRFEMFDFQVSPDGKRTDVIVWCLNLSKPFVYYKLEAVISRDRKFKIVSSFQAL